MDDLIGHSITYRVAVGPRAGQKVFALQTVPASEEGERREGVAQYAGFSLHAGTALEGEERGKLERLARYVTRPAVAEERLTLTAQGHVRYRLKSAVSGRDDARGVRAAGFSGAARGAGAAAARASDALPRRVRPACGAAGGDHAGGAGARSRGAGKGPRSERRPRMWR